MLEPIEHIVVVMLENRSFDHMLGYLGLPEHRLPEHGELPVEVDGLREDFQNTYGGQTYHPSPLDEAVFANLGLDPPHDAESVKLQLADGQMSGFVEAFARKLQSESETRNVPTTNPEMLGAVMDYLTPERVPVYDHLARRFCVCENWHCSIPGPTLPNRFFAVAGTTDGIVDNAKLLLRRFGRFTSFFEYLERDWRWYSSDPGILRAVDRKYSLDDWHDRFAYFDQYTEVQPRSFLRDALGDADNGPDLPAVSWIDPNFAMKFMLPSWAAPLWGDGPGSNDDHPPAPAILGQKLVHKIYQAIGRSRYWERAMILVVYDEHGGFFDHKQPPSNFGLRVPALIISPHVKRGVCSATFDHASIIKTILLRFGKQGSWEMFGARVKDAQDLSVVMRDDGVALPFEEITGLPPEAEVDAEDLEAIPLPGGGSTVDRALSFAEQTLTELQFDIVHGIALPLRSGRLFLRAIPRFPWLRRVLLRLARLLGIENGLAPRRP